MRLPSLRAAPLVLIAASLVAGALGAVVQGLPALYASPDELG